MKITDVKGFSILSNGVKMPYLGLGVYKAQNGTEVINAVHYSLDAGYRHIDTAAYYHNEEGVGKAVQTAGMPRGEIFVTTKIWHTEQRYADVFKAFETSMNKLQLDYLDLYLIHWPHPQYFLEAWQAMEELYKAKKIRAIGVCNCTEWHIRKIMDLGGEVPTVNQVEFHPNLVQQSLLDFCQQHNIQLEAWSPLKRGALLNHPVLAELSRKYGKNTAQVILRWDLQKGVVTIPKSVHKERITSNADIFDFELSEEDLKKIDNLDSNGRTGAHPDYSLNYFEEK